MDFVYYITKRFYPTKEYDSFSIVKNRKEIVTMDICLCQQVNFDIYYNEFYGKTNELSYFDDYKLKHDEQVLRFIEEPNVDVQNLNMNDQFIFCGYDLIEKATEISAVTNCGDWYPLDFTDFLNEYGLINNLENCKKVKKDLKTFFSYDDHADCNIFALWRRL